MKKTILFFASISGAMAVALGAMAAHALKQKISTGLIIEQNLQVFETAARYQMYHSIVLLVIGFVIDKQENKLINKAAHCFMLGIVLFSGSLYLLSTAKLIGIPSTNWLGPITPIGGLFFIVGWLLIAFSTLKSKK